MIRRLINLILEGNCHLFPCHLWSELWKHDDDIDDDDDPVIVENKSTLNHLTEIFSNAFQNTGRQASGDIPEISIPCINTPTGFDGFHHRVQESRL
jgi:hypothetical protein